jgi:hypothetical protein
LGLGCASVQPHGKSDHLASIVCFEVKYLEQFILQPVQVFKDDIQGFPKDDTNLDHLTREIVRRNEQQTKAGTGRLYRAAASGL